MSAAPVNAGTTDLEGWHDLTARIYADRDFSPGAREVALALAWALYQEGADEQGVWLHARDLLGKDSLSTGRWRIWEATSEDLPQYSPEWAMYGSCEGPRVRPYRPRRVPETKTCLVSGHHPHLGECRFTIISDGRGHLLDPVPKERDNRTCGAHATIHLTEYDPATGWETRRWFCSRHKDRAREVKQQLRAALPDPPPPIPNRGGVLPRYFAADWATLYALTAEKAHWRPATSGWKPPYYGVCRDDWPVPGRTAIPRRPRLSIVASEPEEALA